MKYKYRAVRIRLYPSALQKERMAQTFGACRRFCNHALELRTRRCRMFGRKEGFRPLSYVRISRHYSKTLFGRHPRLRSVMRAALMEKLIDQEQAMKTRYLKKGKPRFKSRKHEQPFAVPGIDRCRGRIQNNKIKLRRDLQWTCPECGTDHDRDRNAAMNVYSRAGTARRGESLNRDSARLEA